MDFRYRKRASGTSKAQAMAILMISEVKMTIKTIIKIVAKKIKLEDNSTTNREESPKDEPDDKSIAGRRRSLPGRSVRVNMLKNFIRHTTVPGVELSF